MNSIAITFDAAPAGAVNQDANQIAIYTALTGGTRLLIQASTLDPDPVAEGDEYQIAVGGLRITIDPTGSAIDDAMAIRMLTGAVLGTLYVEVRQDGNPITGIPREPITAADWDIA